MRAGLGGPLLSGMGRRSCQSKLGRLSTPIAPVDIPPPAKCSGGSGGPIPLEAVALGSASSPSPAIEPASLETESQDPGLGSSERALWASSAWAGPALPCLSPPWVCLGPRFQAGGCGTHKPYLGCLSVSPQKALWGLAGWPCMYLSYILPHMGQTGVPRPEGQPDFLPLRPKHHRSNGGHSPELRVGFHTQPSSSTRRLGRGGLSEPPGSWAGVAHGGSRAWGRGAALPAFEEVAGGPMGTPAEREAGQAVGLPPQALGPHQDPSSGPLRGTVSCS